MSLVIFSLVPRVIKHEKCYVVSTIALSNGPCGIPTFAELSIIRFTKVAFCFTVLGALRQKASRFIRLMQIMR